MHITSLTHEPIGIAAMRAPATLAALDAASLLTTLARKPLLRIGQVLVAPASDDLAARAELERSAIDQGCDLILGHHDGVSILVGMSTYWMVLWHRDYRAFLSEMGELWFLPPVASGPCFTIRDGRLDAMMEPPYRDEADRQAGIARAQSVHLARMEG
ncbi:MAG: hypothetical protein KGJ57_22870 [Sphingomonadales bacterium]|nr:hypothetical protein [Sphingomonadales bacterium]MDE2172229.1 hypothetical protein [Sphingomonadales bacterium]